MYACVHVRVINVRAHTHTHSHTHSLSLTHTQEKRERIHMERQLAQRERKRVLSFQGITLAALDTPDAHRDAHRLNATHQSAASQVF